MVVLGHHPIYHTSPSPGPIRHRDHGLHRSAVDVSLDRDLLLTFTADCKPEYAPYDGGEDGEDSVLGEAPLAETPAQPWDGL